MWKQMFRGWGLFLLFIVMVFAITAGIWLVRVGVSDPKGAGDAVRTKNAAPNRIAAQERFEEMYADVLTADQLIGTAREALKGDPTDRVLKTNFTGSVNYCITVREKYDAEAEKYTAAEWRSVRLPQKIDKDDPKTDCK